jgi:hypothetical protein
MLSEIYLLYFVFILSGHLVQYRRGGGEEEDFSNTRPLIEVG